MNAKFQKPRPFLWLFSSVVLSTIAFVIYRWANVGETQHWHFPLFMLLGLVSHWSYHYRALFEGYMHAISPWERHRIKPETDKALDRYMARREVKLDRQMSRWNSRKSPSCSDEKRVI